MKKNAYILLDRSGSMESMWKASLDGINNYVTEIGEANVLLASFDSEGYDVIRNVPTHRWVNVTRSDVHPRGGTPLLDAAGRMIWKIIDDNPDRAILIIVTDGHENASVKFKAEEIRRYTDDLRTRKKYEVVFLGANFDGVQDVAAHSFGVFDNSRFVSTDTSYGGTMSAYNATATASAAYFNSGEIAESFYTEADKSNAKSGAGTGSTK